MHESRSLDTTSSTMRTLHKRNIWASTCNVRINNCHWSVKVMEKVIRKQMVKFLEDNGLVDINQHGALNGRSTLTQLLEQQEEILRILEHGERVEVLYLDFSKAFNSCDHSIMLRKMREIGFGGNLLRWIASFLA